MKAKARLMAGGDGQDKTIYENVSSPSVLFCIIAKAAITVDVTFAFLKGEVFTEDGVLMHLDLIFTQIHSKLRVCINPTLQPLIVYACIR